MSGQQIKVEHIVILVPVFNDWPALSAMLRLLDNVLKSKECSVAVLIVDDGSYCRLGNDELSYAYQTITQIEILRLRRNLGHQRAIAIGLAFIDAEYPCTAVVVMDCDGEDDPGDVPRLLDANRIDSGNWIVFAERSKRSENLIFRVFYQLFRLIHFVLTGVDVKIGNFSLIPREQLGDVVAVSELWNHYASAIVRSRRQIRRIPTKRAKRLDGKSTMNFTALVIHGLSAISVYGDVVGVRSLFFALFLALLSLTGIVIVVLIKYTTDLAIPGWATYAVGMLFVMLLQSIMLVVFFVFVVLSNRQSSFFLPIRDYKYFVKGLDHVFSE